MKKIFILFAAMIICIPALAQDRSKFLYADIADQSITLWPFYKPFGGNYHGMTARSIYFPESDVSVGFFTNLGEQFPSENTRMFESTMDELVDVTFTGSRD